MPAATTAIIVGAALGAGVAGGTIYQGKRQRKEARRESKKQEAAAQAALAKEERRKSDEKVRRDRSQVFRQRLLSQGGGSGRDSTILTGPLGQVGATGNTQRKSLLGT